MLAWYGPLPSLNFSEVWALVLYEQLPTWGFERVSGVEGFTLT